MQYTGRYRASLAGGVKKQYALCMTLAVRRALALFFISVFVIVAPTALAYARGFRFDFATRQLKQTGVLLLHGLPKNVAVSIDGQPPRAAALPRTYRSMVPGTHTLRVEAAGYTSQAMVFSIYPGQTTYLTNTQLIRIDPIATVRTGLPANAQLSPDGATVGWIEKGNVVIADAQGIQRTQTVAAAHSLAWLEQTLIIFDAKNIRLGTLTTAGVFTPGGQPQVATSSQATKLAQAAGLQFDHAQRLPDIKSWLVTNAEGAWLLSDAGDSTLVSRWVEKPLSARMVGRSMFLSVRNAELTLRNTTNNQTQTFFQDGIVAVADAPTEGHVSFLVRDGDLRTWMEADFF